jgi:hypothetical protein
VIPTYSH